MSANPSMSEFAASAYAAAAAAFGAPGAPAGIPAAAPPPPAAAAPAAGGFSFGGPAAAAPAAAAPAAAAPAATPLPTTLVISVIAAEEEEIFFKVKRTTKFSRVFKAYYQKKKSLHPEDYCFLTMGPEGRRVVEGKSTCNSLHLSEGSKILCAKDRRALP